MSEYQYKAFISYRHLDFDKRVAVKLHRMLETYKFPHGIKEQKNQWRIFRDEEELSASSNLSDDIKNALDNSEFLIVVCSEQTHLSRWCLEEIEYFKSLHNGTNEKIIPLLISGSPEESFPEELCRTYVTYTDENGASARRETEVSPLAANIVSDSRKGSFRKLNSELLRIVAEMDGCDYDDLYNRSRRRRIRRIAVSTAAAFTAVSMFGIYSSAMLLEISDQREQLQTQNTELETKTIELDTANSSLETKNKELDTANSSLETKNKELDTANSSLETKNKELDTANSTLETKNKELDTANTALSRSNSELDKANSELTESNANLEIKTKEAQDNFVEANNQRKAAEDNLTEAERQREIAEQNLEYAKEQQAIAEENYEEAERQRQTAQSRLETIEQQNREIRISAADIATRGAMSQYDGGDRIGALKNALSMRPNEDDPNELLASTNNFLADALYAYTPGSLKPKLDRTVSTDSAILEIKYSPDAEKLMAWDMAHKLYVWDASDGKPIKTMQTDFVTDAEFIDNDTVIVFDTGYIIKVDFTTGDETVLYEGAYGHCELSDDRTVAAVHEYFGISFVRTSDGSVIYRTAPEIDGNTLSERGMLFMDIGCFKRNTEYIAVASDAGVKDNAGNYMLVKLDIENQTCSTVQTGSNVISAVKYCGENSYACLTNTTGAAAGRKYELKIYENGIEKSTVPFGDYDYITEFECCGMDVDGEYKPVIIFVSWNKYAFVDAETGGIIYKSSTDSNVLDMVRMGTDGILMCCETGSVWSISPAEEKSSLIQTLIPSVSDMACGTHQKYAVGYSNTEIVLYSDKHDEDYTAVIDGSFTGVRYNKDKSLLLAVTDDFRVEVYDAATKEKTAETYMGQPEGLTYLFGFVDNCVVTASDARTLRFYNLDTKREERTVDISGYDLSVIGTSPDESCVIGYGADNIVRVDKSGITETKPPNCGFGDLDSLTVSADGTYAVYAAGRYENGHSSTDVCLVNTVTGGAATVYSAEGELYNAARANMPFTFDDNSNRFIVNDQNKALIFDAETGTRISTVETEPAMVGISAFVPNSGDIIVYGDNSVIYKYNIQTGEKLGSLSAEEISQIPLALLFDPEGNRLIVEWYLPAGNPAWFINLDTMECETRMELAGDFDGVHREVLILYPNITAGRLYFYPYYTSEMLINKAEREIN